MYDIDSELDFIHRSQAVRGITRHLHRLMATATMDNDMYEFAKYVRTFTTSLYEAGFYLEYEFSSDKRLGRSCILIEPPDGGPLLRVAISNKHKKVLRKFIISSIADDGDIEDTTDGEEMGTEYYTQVLKGLEK